MERGRGLPCRLLPYLEATTLPSCKGVRPVSVLAYVCMLHVTSSYECKMGVRCFILRLSSKRKRLPCGQDHYLRNLISSLITLTNSFKCACLLAVVKASSCITQVCQHLTDDVPKTCL
jgi:hypothetical protein